MKQSQFVKIGQYYYRDEPRKEVVALLKYLDLGTVLDVGAGNGNNSLYLLGNGFNVVATETNKLVLPLLKDLQKSFPVELKIIKKDINEFEFARKFDAVLCTMVLHFLPKSKIATAIKKLQDLTKAGGYNVVTAFTKHNDDLKSELAYMFTPNELKSYYSNWEILDYQEKAGRAGHSVPHISARLIARKPKS